MSKVSDPHFSSSPASALARLIEGNNRFAMGLRSVEAMASIFQKGILAQQGQSPFAMVLACADSRTPVEILFDQGLGDLFVLRVAGNIAAQSIVASMEYAILNLGVPLCLVMGHTQCGAIKATVERNLGRASTPSPNLSLLIDEITPAIHRHPDPDNLIEMLTKESKKVVDEVSLFNVSHTISRILEMSFIIKQFVDEEKVMLKGAMYNVATGKVDLC